MILILILYYLVIALLFYRDEIQSFLQPKVSSTGPGQLNYQKADHIVTQKESDEASAGLQRIESDLRGILEAGKEASKEQLLGQLSERLANYAGLRLPALRSTLTKFIITHAKELCGVAFSEQELNAAWNRSAR